MESPSTRNEIVNILSSNLKEMTDVYGVVTIGVFGSAARDQLRATSDVDVLVDFGNALSFQNYLDLQDFLELKLGRKVDLITVGGVQESVKPFIDRDLVSVA